MGAGTISCLDINRSGNKSCSPESFYFQIYSYPLVQSRPRFPLGGGVPTYLSRNMKTFLPRYIYIYYGTLGPVNLNRLFI